MICPKCGYEWNPRVEKPKSCPSCKQYLKELPTFEEIEIPFEDGQTVKIVVPTEKAQDSLAENNIDKSQDWGA